MNGLTIFPFFLSFINRLTQIIFDNTATPMVLADTDGIILQANTSCCETFGYSLDELMGGTSVEIFMPEETRKKHKGYMLHNLKTGNNDTSKGLSFIACLLALPCQCVLAGQARWLGCLGSARRR